MTRRHWLSAMAVTAVARAQESRPAPRKGRLKQCVTRGVFGKGMALEDMCQNAARLGVVGFDLIGPADFPLLKKYGLIPTMVPGAMTLAGGCNHKDYHFDKMWWGVEVCKRVNSPRVKILYDIYHAQIMEGDIIRTIRDNFQWIGHFHTAGNPGRHEMDDAQEMNYKGIARAIADLGYQGYIAHEYSPLRDPIQSLEETLTIFEV